MTESFTVETIATVISPYKTNFGIPRQSGLVSAAQFIIRFQNTSQYKDSLRGLNEFSHIWVIFIFNKLKRLSWKPLVSPPRFKDSRKLGVFATRSPYRKNFIGQSVVKLENIIFHDDYIDIVVTGGDFLDGTPVIDIKPYVAYADHVANAECGWADKVEPSLVVHLAPGVEDFLLATDNLHLKDLITQTLQFDPRPGYERGETKKTEQKYYMKIENLDVEWFVEGLDCIVTNIKFIVLAR